MYQTHGNLPTDVLAVFPLDAGYSGSGLKPGCAWRDSSGVVRVGAWLDDWKQIESAWAWDLLGQYFGARPNMIHPNFLKVPDVPIVIENDDPVYQVESGNRFDVHWLKRTLYNYALHGNVYSPGTVNGRDAHVFIYDAADGSVVYTTTSPSIPLTVSILPDGSYVIYVRYMGIKEGLRLPPDYVPEAQYYYTQQDGTVSYFDPLHFVGEVPADPENPLNVLRRQLVANNEQEDNQEYAAYVTTEKAIDGQPSAIKLQVGGGSWTIASGVFVTPARPLHQLTGTPETVPSGTSPSSLTALATDPLAYNINVAITTRPDGIWGGKVLLGGARISDHATRPALWEWDDVNDKLIPLGTASEACVSYCETAMSIGMITGLTELDDGSIIVLTMCSRHIYNPNAILLDDRLPRWPIETDGEPGGRSIVGVGGKVGTRVLHTTGNGGGFIGDENVMSGNNVCYVQRDKITKSSGTLANVDGALWRHHGKAYGAPVLGDHDKYDVFTDDTKEYISAFNGAWDVRNASPWIPQWLALQRGVSVNGANIAFGFVPGSETAQAVRDNGTVSKVLSCDYRVRAATVTRHKTSAYYQSAMMPAHKVIPADGNTPQSLSSEWYLIETDGGISLDEAPPIIDDPLDPIVPGDGRYWRVIKLPAREALIYCVQLRDVMEGTPFYYANKDLNESRIGVRLRIDSDADLDDIESYIWRVQMDQTIPFFIPAYQKVEMLIVTEAALAPELLPIIAREA